MKRNTKLTLAIYWQQAKRNKSLGLLAVFCVVTSAIIGIATPLYFKKFFDTLSTASSPDAVAPELLSIIFTIGALMIAWRVFWQSSGFLITHFSARNMQGIANTCFAYLHKHSFSFFNNHFVGSLVKQVNYFIRAYDLITDRIIFDMLPLTTNIIAILIVLWQRDIRLAGALLAWVCLFVTVNWLLARYKSRYDLARSEAETKATGILADTITNQSNVKLFTGFGQEKKLFGSLNERVAKLRIVSWSLNNAIDGLQGFLATGLEVGMFVIAIRLWRQGILTIGDFVLVQTYLLTLFDQLWHVGRNIREVYEHMADAEDMTIILNTSHEIADVPNAKKLKVTAGAVVFDHVQFNYNETRTVLDRFSLDIASHEKLALVGPSGAGKSTIVKILLRQHDVTDGHILIDGQDIAKVTQESLWENVSLVPQEPLLFHRTLIENIRYGKPDANDKDVIRAAKLAHCHEFISGFQDKYDTYVGERGVKLSGGERQRVAIARAILRNAPILILDEATSSLDSESERLIQDALTNLMKGKTVIVIAHRLSTIMKMDRIVVVDRGQIIEEGSHADLLKESKGLYKKLWELQAGGFVG